MGSITTKQGCDEAGGTFLPHVFGWMVHVYPYETDAEKVWSTDDDAAGHDNMDRSAMPGMKMNSGRTSICKLGLGFGLPVYS